MTSSNLLPLLTDCDSQNQPRSVGLSMGGAGSPPQLPSMPEMLTVEQFAQRLQVSRATVFVWLQKNILSQGNHYLRIGRVLRFFWPVELGSLNQVPGNASRTLPSTPRQKKSSGPLNWDY